MKDVISVDTILNRIVSQEAITEGGWAEYTLKEEDIKYGNPLHNQAELKKDLHSLLISKLPEKRPTIEQFRGTDLKYDAGAFDGYNKCLDDMHRVIDEMFEVHNEK